ncbi:hypothetical protein [Apis mellifera associated microvirus 34]|nr:hypothetical protein [Apis mellifera associated microvirus 34]
MSEKVKTPTKAEVQQWMQKDIATAVAFLNMLRNDQAMLDALADVALERIKAQEESKQVQPELPLTNG